MEFDRYGFCVLCHKNLVIEQVIDNKVQKRFTTEYDESEVLLDNCSKMRVVTCRDCKAKLTSKDYPYIMEMVRNGWEKELETSTWAEEKKNRYRDKYYKLEIVTGSENKPDEQLAEELVKHKEKNGTRNQTIHI